MNLNLKLKKISEKSIVCPVITAHVLVGDLDKDTDEVGLSQPRDMGIYLAMAARCEGMVNEGKVRIPYSQLHEELEEESEGEAEELPEKPTQQELRAYQTAVKAKEQRELKKKREKTEALATKESAPEFIDFSEDYAQEKAYDYLSEGLDEEKDADKLAYAEAFNVAYPVADKWLIELTLCHKVKPLSPDNITHYFASSKNDRVAGKPFLDLLDYSVSRLSSALEGDSVKADFIKSDFMKYHTSASSSGHLVAMARDCLGAYKDNFFSSDDLEVAETARLDPSNPDLSRKISDKCLATTWVILSAFKKLPDIWYQGARAVAKFPGHEKLKIEAMCKRYAELVSGREIIESSVDVKTLFSSSANGELVLPVESAVNKAELKTTIKRLGHTVMMKKVKEAVANTITPEKAMEVVNEVLELEQEDD